MIDFTSYKVLKEEVNGLSHYYEFSIDATPVVKAIEEELAEKAKNAKMRGFRDGHVPMSIVRKEFGKDITTEVITKVVNSIKTHFFEERSIRPATAPESKEVSFEPVTSPDDLKAGKRGTLTFSLAFESYPTPPAVVFDGISVSKPIISLTEADYERARNEILANYHHVEPAPAGHVARLGDSVIIDFEGKIDGKPFDGSKSDGIRLELGSGQFIKEFEEQLVGSKAKEYHTVTVSFPAEYPVKELVGKTAIFEVNVKEVMIPADVSELDDKFAASIGLENAAQLEEMIKSKIKADFEVLSRLYMKKSLFDAMDAQNAFEVPASMLKVDFDTMWTEIKKMKQADTSKSEEELKADYQKIAARRVRLGIILAELAKQNSISVTDQELQQAVLVEAMQRPGQEKMVIEFYRNKQNLERLRGPLLEEKVVDYILTKISVVEHNITSQEFVERYAGELQLPSAGPGA